MRWRETLELVGRVTEMVESIYCLFSGLPGIEAAIKIAFYRVTPGSESRVCEDINQFVHSFTFESISCLVIMNGKVDQLRSAAPDNRE